MAGRPRGAHARTEVVRVRFTRAGKAAAVARAGSLGLSEYIRALVAADIRKGAP